MGGLGISVEKVGVPPTKRSHILIFLYQTYFYRKWLGGYSNNPKKDEKDLNTAVKRKIK